MESKIAINRVFIGLVWTYMEVEIFISGTASRTRTDTPKARDFESLVSTNFTIAAYDFREKKVSSSVADELTFLKEII